MPQTVLQASAQSAAQSQPFVHRSVLAREAPQEVLTRTDGIYVDATFGRGGHTRTLLSLLGQGARVFAFDRDEEAVRVSYENAKLNNIPMHGLRFEHAGIERALSGKRADIVLANIISDVLCIYADNLIEAVNPGGRLVLSGILASENKTVMDYFLSRLGHRETSCVPMEMGEWSRIEIQMR